MRPMYRDAQDAANPEAEPGREHAHSPAGRQPALAELDDPEHIQARSLNDCKVVWSPLYKAIMRN